MFEILSLSGLGNSGVRMPTKAKKKLTKGIACMKRIYPDISVVTENSTQNLLLVNGGIICGWDEDSLEKILVQFGKIERIVLLAHLPFSFVRFQNIERAERAAKTINNGEIGVEMHSTQTQLYASFVDAIPNLEVSTTNKALSGLFLHQNFVTQQEEAELIELLTSKCPDDLKKTLKNRQAFHFGFIFAYGSNQIDFSTTPPPIPVEVNKFIDRVMTLGNLSHRPNQMTVNIYEAGQGIPLHTDTHSAFEDFIISLSLCSDVLMDFRNPTTGETEKMLLPARSLLVMTDESRYVWSHGITPRKTDTIQNGLVIRRQRRISVTLRCVRRSPCECKFPLYCDYRRVELDSSGHHDLLGSAFLPSSSLEAITLENTCVHKVYEQIADHFNDTRYSQWPGVKKFLQNLPAGSLLCDVGCGNGKYILPTTNNHLIKLGCDRCDRLVDICKQKGCEVFVADGINLPLVSCRFDAAISIAVIHHLSTEERRLQAISELIRILKPEGVALIYVWAFEQRRNSQNSAYLMHGEAAVNDPQPTDVGPVYPGKAIAVHHNRTPFRAADLLVPWELNKPTEVTGTINETKRTVFHRFYHVFREGELQLMCAKVPSCQVCSSYYENGNWCVVLRKTIEDSDKI